MKGFGPKSRRNQSDLPEKQWCQLQQRSGGQLVRQIVSERLLLVFAVAVVASACRGRFSSFLAQNFFLLKITQSQTHFSNSTSAQIGESGVVDVMAVYPCSPPMYTKITQLCDDCLLMIFSYLPLSEVFRLQLVCHRFKTIVRLRCSAMTRSLKMFSSKEFNTNYHSLMKRLNCDSTKEAASTDNVLQLLKESYLPSTLARLPNLFPRVTSLVLDCCVGDFNAYALKFWHQNLTTLSIGCFNGIRKKVRDELLWKNLAPMTALTSLTCMGDNEPKVSDDMVTVLKRLKIFVVDQCPIQWLYHLGPNLVRLHIYNGNHESLTGWEALLDDKDSLPNRRQMTHLQVAGDQSHHSTEHVPTLCHYIVDNFPALTHLDISLFIYKSVRSKQISSFD